MKRGCLTLWESNREALAISTVRLSHYALHDNLIDRAKICLVIVRNLAASALGVWEIADGFGQGGAFDNDLDIVDLA